LSGIGISLRNRLAVLLAALVLGIAGTTLTTATVAQAQDDAAADQGSEEQGFDKWGQLLGLLGLAGLGGLALQRTDEKNDDRGR